MKKTSDNHKEVAEDKGKQPENSMHFGLHLNKKDLILYTRKKDVLPNLIELGELGPSRGFYEERRRNGK